MTWFLRLFSQFRDLQNLADSQVEALRTEIRDHESTKVEVLQSEQEREQERVRRIAAETVASERRAEIDRLIDQLNQSREDLARVNGERLRSVDAINVKLMRESVPEQTPDLAQYRENAIAKATTKLVQSAKDNHRAMDMEILKKLHPAFQKRIVLNEPEAAPVDTSVI